MFSFTTETRAAVMRVRLHSMCLLYRRHCENQTASGDCRHGAKHMSHCCALLHSLHAAVFCTVLMSTGAVSNVSVARHHMHQFRGIQQQQISGHSSTTSFQALSKISRPVSWHHMHQFRGIRQQQISGHSSSFQALSQIRWLCLTLSNRFQE